MRLLRKLNAPLPGGLALVLLLAFGLGTAAVLPTWSSGTATMGPGGFWDLGSVDAAITSPGPSDPIIYNGSGVNLNVMAPNGGNLNLRNCTTNTCNTSAQQITTQITANQVNSVVPMYAAPSPSADVTINPATTGPVAPCYSASGNGCNAGWKVVHGSVQVAFTTTCPSATLCSLGTGSGHSYILNFNGNGVFSETAFSQYYGCSASSNDPNGTIAFIENENASTAIIQIYNTAGTALPSSTNPYVGWMCFGY
jgi:hypothetical protein